MSNPLEKSWKVLAATPAVQALSPDMLAGMKVFYMAGAADAISYCCLAPDIESAVSILTASLLESYCDEGGTASCIPSPARAQ